MGGCKSSAAMGIQKERKVIGMNIREAEFKIRSFQQEFEETFESLKKVQESGDIFHGGAISLALRNLVCCHDAQLHWRNCLAAIKADRRKKNGNTIS